MWCNINRLLWILYLWYYLFRKASNILFQLLLYDSLPNCMWSFHGTRDVNISLMPTNQLYNRSIIWLKSSFLNFSISIDICYIPALSYDIKCFVLMNYLILWKIYTLGRYHIKMVSITVIKETLVTGICYSYLLARILEAKGMIVGLP